MQRLLITSHGIDNVELINAGLGERKDILTMLISDEAGQARGGSSKILASEENNAPGRAENVQIVTIDDVIPPDRRVSIIQLDVEGHEKQALTGARKTIQRCLPKIILEVLPDSLLIESNWFSINILSLGYKMAGSVHRNSIFTCSPE